MPVADGLAAWALRQEEGRAEGHQENPFTGRSEVIPKFEQVLRLFTCSVVNLPYHILKQMIF